MGDMPPGPERLHAKAETFRLAWRDRFRHLADPEQVVGVAAAVDKMLSDEYLVRGSTAYTHRERDTITTLQFPLFWGLCDILMLPRSRYAAALAAEVKAAVAAKTAIDTGVEADPQNGTLHFAAADAAGTIVSVTLTHGGSFGGQLTSNLSLLVL